MKVSTQDTAIAPLKPGNEQRKPDRQPPQADAVPFRDLFRSDKVIGKIEKPNIATSVAFVSEGAKTPMGDMSSLIRPVTDVETSVTPLAAILIDPTSSQGKEIDLESNSPEPAAEPEVTMAGLPPDGGAVLQAATLIKPTTTHGQNNDAAPEITAKDIAETPSRVGPDRPQTPAPVAVAQAAGEEINDPLIDQANVTADQAIEPSGDTSLRPGERPQHQTAATETIRAQQVPPAQVRAIVVQVVQSMNADAARNIEISLDPVELGKIHLSLQPSEGGMTVQVTAERPETLDLMRKSVSELQADIMELGYSDVGFEWGRGDRQPYNDPNEPDATDQRAIEVDAGQGIQSAILQSGGMVSDQLDLRL